MSETGETPSNIPNITPKTTPETTPDKPGVTRRSFIIRMGALAASAFLGSSASPQPPDGPVPQAEARQEPAISTQKPEAPTPPEIIKDSRINVLDLFGVEDFINKSLLSELTQKELTEAELWQTLKVNDPTKDDELKQANPTTNEEKKLLLLQLLKNRYVPHGKAVTLVMKATTHYLGLQQLNEPTETSIAEGLKIGDTIYDDVGNPTISLFMDPAVIERLVAQSDEEVINMSFEMGKFGIKYLLNELGNKNPEAFTHYNDITKGIVRLQNGETIETFYNKVTKQPATKEEYEALQQASIEKEVQSLDPRDREMIVLDGYSPQNTEAAENVRSLANLARKYPKKTFVAAAGNPQGIGYELVRPDLRVARKELEEASLWPENLIVVGVHGMENGYTGAASYGADVYVSHEDLERLGFNQASSFATPVVSTIMRSLLDTHDKNISGAKQALLNMTMPEGFADSNDRYVYPVLDFKKVREQISVV